MDLRGREDLREGRVRDIGRIQTDRQPNRQLVSKVDSFSFFFIICLPMGSLTYYFSFLSHSWTHSFVLSSFYLYFSLSFSPLRSFLRGESVKEIFLYSEYSHIPF